MYFKLDDKLQIKLLLVLHVDDIAITGTNVKIDLFGRQRKSKFEFGSEKPLHDFLSLQTSLVVKNVVTIN